jgi:TatD DNase family protein
VSPERNDRLSLPPRDEAFAADLDDVDRAARGGRASTDALCILSAGDEAEAARARGVRAAMAGVRFATGVHPHSAGTFAGRADASADVDRGARRGVRGVRASGDRPRLPLRFRAARRAAGGLRGPARAGAELRLPVIIHTREATDDTFAILKEAGETPGCFTALPVTLRWRGAPLDIGFHVSFAGIVTFPKRATCGRRRRLCPRIGC